MKFRLRKIISLLLICTLILSTNRVGAATEDQGTILVNDLSVTNPNYYGSFTIAKDSSKKINIGTTPKKVTNKTLDWKSSNESIVKVSDSGIIQGIKNGKANIIVTTKDGSNITETIPVIVGVPVKKITSSIKAVTLNEDETKKVTMKVSPSNASNPELILKSSNEAIAKVSSDGVITGVSVGKTSIYAVTKDGTNRRASVVVTVKGTTVSKTLTYEDVIDGKIVLSNTKLRNLTIESSVGDAEIILDHVTVRGDLMMENGAKYSVSAKECEINNVIALEESSDTNTNANADNNGISSFALNPEANDTKESPTFIAEKGTLVVNIDARGNVSVRQENTSVIGTVTISRNLDGKLEVKLEGFDGNLVVNTASNADINIITNSCNIAEATISGANTGQLLSIQDDTSEGGQSTIDKINIDTNAEVKVDIPAKELFIPSTVEAANVKVEKPVEKIVNEGKGTALKVNNDIGSIESTGEKLVMKIAAGSEIKEVTSQGAGSQIDVALGSKISNIVSSGADSQIGGSGTIDSVTVQGNNTVINNDKANVTVDQNVQGTKANGIDVTGGNSTGGSTSTNPPAPPVIVPTVPAATAIPTEKPSATAIPTEKPAATAIPTEKPAATAIPTEKPAATAIPTEKPAATAIPTEKPAATAIPTEKPAATAIPTEKPAATAIPTEKPAATAIPTEKPAATAIPTEKPAATAIPTEKPAATAIPTEKPEQPTVGPSPSPVVTASPTQTPPQTGTVITIQNPGKISAGQEVQLIADMESIRWSVYNYIDKTSGYAIIDASTGLLTAIDGGTVRIVATSMLNDEVYGAVDITINCKKFVRMVPFDTVTISEDLNLSCISDLEKNNLLPKTIDLVYETGNGAETEIVTVDLYNNWYGSYSGDTKGTYLLHNYISIGREYERPDNLIATICVQLDEAQTDLRKEIVSVEELPDIVLDTDEKLIKFYQVYNKYFGETKIQLTCNDGTLLSCAVDGYYGGGTDEFNGAVEGIYEVMLAVTVPEGYVYNKVNSYFNNVHWNEWASVDIPVTITVQVPQTPTPYEEPIMPPTTQQKFPSDNTKAVIDSVEIIGAPTTFIAGEVVDFSQYLKVNTTSDLASDQRVTWTVNGYNSEINSMTGYALLTYGNDIMITATSVIDKSKSSTIIVGVTSKLITSLTKLEPIVIKEDKSIIDFESMYANLKNLLPKYLYVKVDGEDIRLKIQGWGMEYKTSKTMQIRPMFHLPISYQWSEYPSLTITFDAPQSDHRIKVTSATPLVTEYTLDEDKYAASDKALIYATVGENALIPVTAVLANGEEEQLQCTVVNWFRTNNYLPIGYQGTLGDVTYQLQLKYPEGYVASNPQNDQIDVNCGITVHVTVEQTPMYEMLWVTQQPKLTYHIGESLDLSELIVRVRDSYSTEVLTYSYLGITKFAESELELRLSSPYGELVEPDRIITPDLNGKYLFVYNKHNGEYASFGPIKVEMIAITGFEPCIISNGAVNALYYDTIDLVAFHLPNTLMSNEGVEVPVIYWYRQPDTSDFGQKAASYTFTAQLGQPPMGYAIGEDVVGTAVVTIAETLNIEWIEQLEDIVVPLSYEHMPITLPSRISVRLSDGVTSNHWLPVQWDLSNFNSTIAGEYVFTGKISSSLINDQNLVPSVKVVVTRDQTVALVDLNIISLPSKLLYKQGEALNLDGLRVIGSYADGSTTDITSDIIIPTVTGSAISVVTGSAIGAVSGAAITGFDSTVEGLKNITISYLGLQESFSVYVDSLTTSDYTILFVENNNSMFPMNIPYGSYTPLPPERIKQGYVFDGWYSMGMKLEDFQVISSDMVAYATWNIIEIIDHGVHAYENELPVHEFTLYVKGEQIYLVSTENTNASIKNGKLFIDIYHTTSKGYSYMVCDNSGRTYNVVIDSVVPKVLNMTKLDTVVTINMKPCWIYKLNDLKNPQLETIRRYTDECDTVYGTDHDGNVSMCIPTDTAPGTYKIVIEFKGEFYKAEITMN